MCDIIIFYEVKLSTQSPLSLIPCATILSSYLNTINPTTCAFHPLTTSLVTIRNPNIYTYPSSHLLLYKNKCYTSTPEHPLLATSQSVFQSLTPNSSSPHHSFVYIKAYSLALQQHPLDPIVALTCTLKYAGISNLITALSTGASFFSLVVSLMLTLLCFCLVLVLV